MRNVVYFGQDYTVKEVQSHSRTLALPLRLKQNKFPLKERAYKIIVNDFIQLLTPDGILIKS
jgi:hypothetical protein